MKPPESAARRLGALRSSHTNLWEHLPLSLEAVTRGRVRAAREKSLHRKGEPRKHLVNTGFPHPRTTAPEYNPIWQPKCGDHSEIPIKERTLSTCGSLRINLERPVGRLNRNVLRCLHRPRLRSANPVLLPRVQW